MSFFDDLLGGPARKKSKKTLPKVKSRYLENDEETLKEAVTHLDRPTMTAFQKQIRKAGFKGATVHGWSQGGNGGLSVTYQGQEYDFKVEEK